MSSSPQEEDAFSLEDPRGDILHRGFIHTGDRHSASSSPVRKFGAERCASRRPSATTLRKSTTSACQRTQRF
jgi:hypothetical protein